ncbi:MAG: hypothetical protein JRD04_08965 [Deltaproteobacteria bacterium]|nr:hypothetical protein [Deltaproteobacteria bacterium]
MIFFWPMDPPPSASFLVTHAPGIIKRIFFVTADPVFIKDYRLVAYVLVAGLICMVIGIGVFRFRKSKP